MRERLQIIASHKIVLPLILVLCLALRLSLAFTYSDVEARQDAAFFVEIARNIADGNGFSLGTAQGTGQSGQIHPSAYGYVFCPYFFAAMMYAFPDSGTSLARGELLPVYLAQSIIDTLTCFLIFLMALRVTSSRLTATAVALLYALYPPFLVSACHPFPETTATAIMACAAFLLLSAFRGGKWGFAFAGALMGLAILARPSMLLFPLFLGLVMCLKRRQIRGWFGNAAVYALAAYLVVSPWTIRNYLVFHAFVPVTSNAGITVYGSTGAYDGKCLCPFYPVVVAGRDQPKDPLIAVVSKSTFRKLEKLRVLTDPLGEVPRDAVMKRAAIQEIKEHPGRFAILAIKKPFRLWFNLWGDFPISAQSYLMAACNIVLLGCALLAFRRTGIDSRFKIIAATMLIYITLVSTGTCAGMRYSYPFMPYVMILAASLVLGCSYKPEAADGASCPEVAS